MSERQSNYRHLSPEVWDVVKDSACVECPALLKACEENPGTVLNTPVHNVRALVTPDDDGTRVEETLGEMTPTTPQKLITLALHGGVGGRCPGPKFDDKSNPICEADNQQRLRLHYI